MCGFRQCVNTKLLSKSGRLRTGVVYFNSFYGLRLVDFNPFWFFFLIHKLGVPLLLLFIKTNC